MFGEALRFQQRGQNLPGVSLHLQMPAKSGILPEKLEHAEDVFLRRLQLASRLRIERHMKMNTPFLLCFVLRRALERKAKVFKARKPPLFISNHELMEISRFIKGGKFVD